MIFNNFGFNTLRTTFAATPPPGPVGFTGSYYFAGNFTTASSTVPQARISKYKNGVVDNNFKIGSGFNAQVEAIAVQLNGRVIAVGDFGTFNGVSARRIVGLNTNGTVDTSFNVGTGTNRLITSIVVQPDQKVYAIGTFNNYSGSTVNKLMRINTNGTLDTSFSAGTGFDFEPYAIAVQADGKVLAGGDFTAYSGSTLNNLVRTNTNGSVDSSFSIGSGFNGPIRSIAVQADQKVLAGGDFTSYNGTSINRIVRLDTNGSRDTSFSVGSGFDNSVRSIVVQSDGKVLVGGNFTSYNDTSINRIVRVNTNGSIDSSFNVGAGFNAIVNSIAIQSDGKVLAGGDFTTYQGQTANRSILLESNGNIASTSASFNNTVKVVAIKESDDPAPSPATGGLFLYLDAGLTDSYAGTGNSWIDLSATTGSNTVVFSSGFTSASWINTGTSSSYFTSSGAYFGTSSLNMTGLPVSASAWSISTWFMNTSNWSVRGIANWGGGSQNYMITDNSAERGGNNVELRGGSQPSDRPAANPLNTGQWYNIVYTYTTGSGAPKTVYINGTLAPSTAGSTNPTIGTIRLQGAPNKFGVMQSIAGPALVGRVAIYRMWNTCLTSEQVTNEYNYFKNRYGLT